MKTLKLMSLLLAALLLTANLFAQEEMTYEEWQNEINRLTQQKAEFTKELNALQSDVNSLKAKYEGMQTYEDCMDDLYSIVGASKSDVDDFRNKVNMLDGKINRKESPKADRQAELDALKSNKISALPEFFDRVHNQMQRKLDAWEEKPAEVNYTVVKGDHLWGIAKKEQHYGNPFAWPKIYEANRDQIKNPDLIYPKQVFKIPNLTDEEKAKYEKLRRNYKPAPPAQNNAQ
ncbi:MAG: LysM peptidoglycan-binding domain-containing protein [Melioribacteraceae bacterium]|nr:LysM peptidoglycan-binding domain-containing protein [Melioribacteraceae bacterium]